MALFTPWTLWILPARLGLAVQELFCPREEFETGRDKGIGLPEVTQPERPGMLHLFLQRQKRKQSKAVVLLSQTHTVCQSRGNVSAKF